MGDFWGVNRIAAAHLSFLSGFHCLPKSGLQGWMLAAVMILILFLLSHSNSHVFIYTFSHMHAKDIY